MATHEIPYTGSELDTLLLKSKFTNVGSFTGTDYINFDFVGGFIHIPNGVVIFGSSFNSSWQVESIPIPTNGIGACALWFDNGTSSYHAENNVDFPTYATNDDLYLIAVFWRETQTVTGASAPYKVNGVFPGTYGEFAELTDRLILPDKMYFLTGIQLPIYKNSILPYDQNIDTVKTVLIENGITSTSPRYNYFYENINLNPATLPTTFKIGVKPRLHGAYNYYKEITKVVTDPSTKTAATPKILCIGDSLTNNYITSKLKARLAAVSINATMVGTYHNDGSELCEGRGGWGFQHFVGQRNDLYGSPIIPQTTEPGPSALLNPFLKLADATDKSNHPTWCFRNTGALNELSYQSDPVKTGNFYIFDFAHYLSGRSVTTPDIVTIGLSTNDIWLDGSAGLAKCALGLEIMISQIHTAAPSAKIGVIPAPVWSDYSWGDTDWNLACAWIENCITYINSLNASSYLSVVPAWCHMDRTWNFPYDPTAALSATNNEVKATRSELVHFGLDGVYQYVEPMAAYVVSLL